MTAKVLEMLKSNFRDIPATLRVIADEIESGEHGEVLSAVVVLERPSGTPEIFGLGNAEYLRSMGLLQLGAHYLATMKVKCG